jgi:F-type H+-transporting ATPase subunit epsilon
MELRVLLPDRELLRTEAVRIDAEGGVGAFTLLPHHVDLLTALVPGILTYQAGPTDQESFVAIDEGLLVKRGSVVVVSVRRAVPSADLASLRSTLEREFLRRDASERQARRVLDRLESSFLLGLIDIGAGS